jgi:hypothetical protein
MSQKISSCQQSSFCKNTADNAWVIPKEETPFGPSGAFEGYFDIPH